MISSPDIRERDKNGHLKAGIRLPGWDYCKPWFYMITLVVKRRRAILGEIRAGRARQDGRRRWQRLSSRIAQQDARSGFASCGLR